MRRAVQWRVAIHGGDAGMSIQATEDGRERKEEDTEATHGADVVAGQAMPAEARRERSCRTALACI